MNRQSIQERLVCRAQRRKKLFHLIIKLQAGCHEIAL